MYRGSQRGWMEIIAGVMFSGKSEELIRRVRRAVIARQVHKDTTVVAIDEVQFLNAAIVDVAPELVTSGRRVILAGTDTDFRGEPFGAMPAS